MQIVGGALTLPKYRGLPSFPASSMERFSIVDSLDTRDLSDEALFYHRIFGPIIAQDYGYRWLFSTQRFVDDLRAADENPKIIAHFLHVCSGGGEAWFLDRAAEAVRNCTKPVYAFVEQCCCSGAYYISANASVIKCYTQNDTIGSVGCMTSFLDPEGYYESLGFKHIEVYATKSDLKNKKYNDLRTGNPDQYIKEELNPIQGQFEREIRTAREKLAALPEDHPAMRGETFNADKAVEVGLIDGIVDIREALQEAYELGITIKNNNNILNEM